MVVQNIAPTVSTLLSNVEILSYFSGGILKIGNFFPCNDFLWWVEKWKKRVKNCNWYHGQEVDGQTGRQAHTDLENDCESI